MAAFEDMVSGKVSSEDYQHKRGRCEKHIQRLEIKIKELEDAKRQAKGEEPGKETGNKTYKRTIRRYGSGAGSRPCKFQNCTGGDWDECF